MTVREFLDKLDLDYRQSLWNILVDGFPLEKPEGPVLDKEIGKWLVDFGLEDRYFIQILRIYTSECLSESEQFKKTLNS